MLDNNEKKLLINCSKLKINWSGDKKPTDDLYPSCLNYKEAWMRAYYEMNKLLKRRKFDILKWGNLGSKLFSLKLQYRTLSGASNWFD